MRGEEVRKAARVAISFNEAAGVDPADASVAVVEVARDGVASMRPRG